MSSARPESDAGPAPLTGVALGVTAFALALGTFMQVLDTTIANVSLTTISGHLGVSSDNSTWIITSFAVANGITVPLTGWLMGRYGVVRTFVGAVTLFTLASLLCGLAWNLSSLIAFRVLQGAVSGPMIPGSQALLISIFPPTKRSTALGIWSITTLLAPVAGPILGGYISDNWHWSWIFLINVPVGLFAGLVTWNSLKSRDTPTRKLPIDRVGLLLLAFWVGSLQIMLDLGKNADWFSSTEIVLLAAMAAIGFISWVIWELTEEHPVVDLRLFKRRSFALGTLALCLGYSAFFSSLLVMPLWLQTQVGYTATWAGLVTAPSGLLAIVLTPFFARISSKVDARILATVAFVSFALSYLLRSGYTADASYWDFAWPLLFQGVGMSTFFLAMMTLLLDGIPPAKIPAASGISNFARITAGSFAASITTTFWDRREALHQARMSELTTAYAPTFQHTLDTMMRLGLSAKQAAAMVERQMVGQAYLLATNDIFHVCAIISGVSIALVWLLRRPKALEGPVAAD